MDKTTISYERILAELQGELWAILPEKLQAICQFLAVRAAGGEIPKAEREAIVALNGGPREPVVINRTAIIPVFGTIVNRANMFTEASGGTSADILAKQINDAVKDNAIKSIILDIDSPGGAARGMTELAGKIREARKAKRIVAQVSPMAASAAYWIASQASEIVSMPSGVVGSIGVIAAHEDLSKAMEMQGIKVTLLKAGKNKGEGNPYQPLSEEDRDAIQEQVNELYEMFVSDVAKGRGVSRSVIRAGYGEGRVVSARKALVEGMIDRIGTMDETISRLAPRSNIRAEIERIAEEAQTKREFESALCDAGFSRSQAKAFAAAFQPSGLRDAALPADEHEVAVHQPQRDAAEDSEAVKKLLAAYGSTLQTQAALNRLKQ